MDVPNMQDKPHNIRELEEYYKKNISQHHLKQLLRDCKRN